ncbi:MAG: hypothetical protein ABMA64_10925 [Myxococcota bacterium]
MAWFEGTHSETFTVARDPAATRAHFADPAVIVAHTEGLQSHAIEGDVVHFVMKPQDHGVVKFAGDYRCRYTLDGDVLRWSPAGGNTRQSGEATFRAAAGGTEVTYTETIEVELEVNAMMAPMLKLVMGPMLAHEAKEYVRRMVSALTK